MSKEDLIPFNTLPPERLSAISSMGGKAGDPAKKSLGMKIRWLKEKGKLGDVDSAYMVELLTNPNINAMQMHGTIQAFEEYAKDNPALLKDLNTMRQIWHKTHFGDKKQVDVRSVNVNIDAPLTRDELKDIMGDDFFDEP